MNKLPAAGGDAAAPPVPAVAFVAPSGTGKTTFLVEAVKALTRLGLTVGVVKHAPHGYDTGPGQKDSSRYSEAGASPTAVVSGNGLALSLTTRGGEMPPEAIIARYMSDTDLVLLEGYKDSSFPKVEVHRRDRGAAPLFFSRSGTVAGTLLAVVSDAQLELPVPRFPLDDPLPLCSFLVERFVPRPVRRRF